MDRLTQTGTVILGVGSVGEAGLNLQAGDTNNSQSDAVMKYVLLYQNTYTKKSH